MSWKLKLFTVLNAVGWLVVVPILAGALLDPFVDFRGWPGGSLFDSQRDSVRLADLDDRDRSSRGAARDGRVLVLPGGARVPAPSLGSTDAGNGPEARPGLQNRLLVGAGTVAEEPFIALRDSASFTAGRPPGADRPLGAVPVSGVVTPQNPTQSNPPSAGGSVPLRAVDRPIPELPQQPDKDSGPTALSEGPAPVEEPEPVATPAGGEPPVTTPETPAPPEPGSDAGPTEPDPTTPPPPDEDDDDGHGHGKAVQPSKQNGPSDDDGHGNGNGNGNG